MKRKAAYQKAGNKGYKVRRTRQEIDMAIARDVRRGRLPANYGRSSSELKGLDTLLTQASPIVATTTGSENTSVLNLVPPGSGSYNRVGRKIRMKSVRLRGLARFQCGQAGTTGNYTVYPLRMIVVLDKQPSGAQPIFSDIFGYTPQTGTEASTVMSNLRYDNTDRFKVLKDVLLEPDKLVASALSGGTEVDSFYSVKFDEYIKLNGVEAVYSGQSATQTIADISSNALYVIWRATVATSSAVHAWEVTADSIARLRYYD